MNIGKLQGIGSTVYPPKRGKLSQNFPQAVFSQNGALAGPNTAYGIRMHGNLITL